MYYLIPPVALQTCPPVWNRSALSKVYKPHKYTLYPIKKFLKRMPLPQMNAYVRVKKFIVSQII